VHAVVIWNATELYYIIGINPVFSTYLKTAAVDNLID
jgi:hypothetical protein